MTTINEITQEELSLIKTYRGNHILSHKFVTYNATNKQQNIRKPLGNTKS